MRRSDIDGEGVAWAIGAFVASLLIGLLVEPFRAAIGLENIVILYLLVVVAAAGIGGRAAGMVAALSAALAYDYFLTTPLPHPRHRQAGSGHHRGLANHHRPRGQHRRPVPPAVSSNR